MGSLDGDERFSQLVSWSAAQGGRIHQAAEIFRDEQTNVSLRIRQSTESHESHLEPGDEVVRCPLSTTLSFLNVLVRGRPLGQEPKESSVLCSRLAFPGGFIEQIPPHVLGRLFLVQQFLLGRESHWHAYIASLPQPEHSSAWTLPAFWGEEPGAEPGAADGPALLRGTNAGIAAAEMRSHVEKEFQDAQDCMQKLGFPAAADFTRLLYHWAFCIFTSRSFRPSLVLSAETQAALTRSSEGPAGEEDESGANWLPALPATCKMDDYAILLPVLDLANHDPRAQVTWEATTTTTSTATMPTSYVSFKTHEKHGAGQQIFNNYGMKTNSELLLGYGFLLPATRGLHNDYVHLRKRRDIQETAQASGDSGIAGSSISQRPQDFLLSRRPLDDPSSVIGASRQWPRRREEHREAGANAKVTASRPFLPPAFSRFEDALLWDLCTQMWTPTEQQRAWNLVRGDGIERSAQLADLTLEERTSILDTVLAEPQHEQQQQQQQQQQQTRYGAAEFDDLQDRMRQTLFAKVASDFERLAAAEELVAEDEEDVEEKDLSYWRLAVAYREQYRAVLIETLQGLDPDVELVEA